MNHVRVARQKEQHCIEDTEQDRKKALKLHARIGFILPNAVVVDVDGRGSLKFALCVKLLLFESMPEPQRTQGVSTLVLMPFII